jgi:2-C-methyl-D-erythritol 4-phosphate cytidylyltransferase
MAIDYQGRPVIARTSLPLRSIDVILPAAGKSRRFNAGRKKIFANLGNAMVWEHSVARLRQRAEINRILIAIDPEDRPIWEAECGHAISSLQVELVDGGAERVDSVRRCLVALAESSLPSGPNGSDSTNRDAIAGEPGNWIAVHDAARPLVRDDDLDAVFTAASESGAAMLASPIRGTVKLRSFKGQFVQQTIDRSRLWEALTPQVFRSDMLRAAYHRWNGFPVTDDAQLVERMGHSVRLIEGSPTNIKITVADDLRIAAALLGI